MVRITLSSCKRDVDARSMRFGSCAGTSVRCSKGEDVTVTSRILLELRHAFRLHIASVPSDRAGLKHRSSLPQAFFVHVGKRNVFVQHVAESSITTSLMMMTFTLRRRLSSAITGPCGQKWRDHSLVNKQSATKRECCAMET